MFCLKLYALIRFTFCHLKFWSVFALLTSFRPSVWLYDWRTAGRIFMKFGINYNLSVHSSFSWSNTKVTLYMKTYSIFCMNVPHNSLNIYQCWNVWRVEVVKNEKLSFRGAYIFQKCSSRLKTLSAKGDVQHVLQWGLTGIRNHLTKHSHPSDLTPGICTPLFNAQYIFFSLYLAVFELIKPKWAKEWGLLSHISHYFLYG
jgi:hypothetical protein